MEIATDRLGILLDQFDSARETAGQRFRGLGDDEYFWEPASPAWSVRPRGEAASRAAFGPGQWQLDFELTPTDPPPVTTIAWRIAHVTSGLAGRWEWTFGGRSRSPDTLVDFAPDAASALELWSTWLDRWRAGVAALTPAQLDEVGFGQYPWGLDRQLPFVGIVWWVNQELIHHHAEIALLRDLWRASGS